MTRLNPSNEVTDVVQSKKRGRPRKDVIATDSTLKPEVLDEVQQSKKRGRPRKNVIVKGNSLNDATLNKVQESKKRGRGRFNDTVLPVAVYLNAETQKSDIIKENRNKSGGVYTSFLFCWNY